MKHIMTDKIEFTARTIPGSGIGKRMGFPTINLNLSDIPKSLPEGVYAGFVFPEKLPCAISYGPRPTVNGDTSFEVHLINKELLETPSKMTIRLIARLRNIRNFKSVAELKEQIGKDIVNANAVLNRLE